MNTEWTDEPDRAADNGVFGDLEFDEELEAQWEAEWDQAERDAVEVLRHALADWIGARAPAGVSETAAAARARMGDDDHLCWVAQAAGLDLTEPPGEPAEFLITATAATISPQEETGLDVEEEATLISLEHPDWLGAIVTAVRRGPGSDASPQTLAAGVADCPEVVLDAPLDIDDTTSLQTAFSIVALPWLALGIVDSDDRLTALGEWILPRALARAWNGDFDREPDA